MTPITRQFNCYTTEGAPQVATAQVTPFYAEHGHPDYMNGEGDEEYEIRDQLRKKVPCLNSFKLRDEPIPVQFTTVTVTIQRPNGDVESYDLSLGGGPITSEKEYIRDLLALYAADATNKIEEIRVAQNFLVCSGYGLSNVILLEVSEQKEVFE